MITWPDMTQLTGMLIHAPDPVTVFGADAKRAKKNYHRLLKYVHPDKGGNAELTATVNTLWDCYAPIDAVFAGFPALYWLGAGDIATVFEGIGGEVIKVVSDPADNDLMANEVAILADLAISPGYTDMQRYFPTAVSAMEGDKAVTILQYDPVVPEPRYLWTLKDLAGYYNHQVNPKHIGWIWRRILAALGFIHYHGIIHAAVTPDNILIEPIQHGVILIDWIHASKNQRPLRSIAAKWLDMYPQSVVDRLPPTPGLDIYTAAKSMLWANPDLPDAMQLYFKWCAGESDLGRPDRFNLLLSEFDRTIYDKLGWKREFVPMDDLFTWEALWKS